MIIGTGTILILFGIFGLIVGSFLNVVILRHGTMTLQGRSECPKCHHQLKWYELVPLFSFVIQKGVCRNCDKKISLQYPLVELLTGIAFTFSGMYLLSSIIIPTNIILSIVAVISFLTIVSFSIIISVYDAKTQKVPLTWFFGLVISTIIFLLTYYVIIGFYLPSLLPHIVGLIVVTPFLFLYLISRGKWIGFADIEIIAWMGLYLGIISSITAVLSAFYLGAVVALLFIGYKLITGNPYKSLRNVKIAFAPFLLISWFVTVVFSWNLFSLVASLFI